MLTPLRLEDLHGSRPVLDAEALGMLAVERDARNAAYVRPAARGAVAVPWPKDPPSKARKGPWRAKQRAAEAADPAFTGRVLGQLADPREHRWTNLLPLRPAGNGHLLHRMAAAGLPP